MQREKEKSMTQTIQISSGYFPKTFWIYIFLLVSVLCIILFRDIHIILSICSSAVLAISHNLHSFSYIFCHFHYRSCIIEPEQLHIKICTLETVINRIAYPADYCHLEGAGRQSQPMPIRWMAWESVLMVSFLSSWGLWEGT